MSEAAVDKSVDNSKDLSKKELIIEAPSDSVDKAPSGGKVEASPKVKKGCLSKKTKV